MRKKIPTCIFVLLIGLAAGGQAWAADQPGCDLLQGVARPQDYVSKRVSSYDPSGGNRDSWIIEPGQKATLADIQGPGAIHHLWFTIAAEPFYSKKIVLRIFWDGENTPSVEAPIGDFFGVGWGIDRGYSSLPFNVSSEGRARNCYWFMPFRRSARVEVENQGRRRVEAFYFYIDYRLLSGLAADTPYFHAQYHQEFPPRKNENYPILEAAGRGHYVGCSFSVMNQAGSWWGEGDDMIYVDGENSPSLHGTGSEDYFSDAWGMRPAQAPFYGCPLQEEDFALGSKASVYRFHIPDPIPFTRSIRVTIEHGSNNDRFDYLSSVAYWYQAEPHQPFGTLPQVTERLPYAVELPLRFVLPAWKQDEKETSSTVFIDSANGLTTRAAKLLPGLSAYYDSSGERIGYLQFQPQAAAEALRLAFVPKIVEHLQGTVFFLKGPAGGNFAILHQGQALNKLNSFAEKKELASLELKEFLPQKGENVLTVAALDNVGATGSKSLDVVGVSFQPSRMNFVTEWRVIGPFDNSDSQGIQRLFPPEKELNFNKTYIGKNNQTLSWRVEKTRDRGFLDLAAIIKPSEYGVAYGAATVIAAAELDTVLLLGSDDEVKVWLNGEQIHFHSVFRGCYPDQDTVPVHLKKGKNSLLFKVSQGGGGWAFCLRIPDPQGIIHYEI